MPEASVVSIAVVCEADADRRIACGLADRVICAQVDWISAEVLDSYRVFRGWELSEPYLEWRKVRSLAAQAGIRAHGHFRGEPGAPDASAARRALLLLLVSSPPPDAVLLIRDSDGDEDRRRGLKQARGERAWQFAIAIGVAHTKRECWVLNGFEPSDDQERKLLAEEQRKLGLDPCSASDRLTAKHDSDKLSAKRIFRVLTEGDKAREEPCWVRSDLTMLRDRGRSTGLAEYLSELQDRIVPLFGPTTTSGPG